MHTILVVDDEAAIVEVLRAVLEDAGYRVLQDRAAKRRWSAWSRRRSLSCCRM